MARRYRRDPADQLRQRVPGGSVRMSKIDPTPPTVAAAFEQQARVFREAAWWFFGYAALNALLLVVLCVVLWMS